MIYAMKLREYADNIFIDPRKLTNYALDLDNPKGRNKALMFQQYLGYTKDNYQALLEQIKTKVLDAEATPQLEDQYGRRYQVDLEIQGIQTEQIENVRTGWLIPPDSNQARLITAYIKRKS